MRILSEFETQFKLGQDSLNKIKLDYHSRDDITKLIKDVELEIGGQKIDKQTGDWMETWAELTELNPTGKTSGGDIAQDGTIFQNMSGMGGSGKDGNSSDVLKLSEVKLA